MTDGAEGACPIPVPHLGPSRRRGMNGRRGVTQRGEARRETALTSRKSGDADPVTPRFSGYPGENKKSTNLFGLGVDWSCTGHLPSRGRRRTIARSAA